MLTKFLFGLFAAFVASSSFAQTCPAGQEPFWTHTRSTDKFSSGSAACADHTAKLTAVLQAQYASSTTITRNGSFISPAICRITGNNVNNSTGVVSTFTPTDVTMGTGCRVPPVPPPPPRKCPVPNGGKYSFNRTEGWAASDQDGSPVTFNQSPTGSTYDTGECMVDISGGLTSKACYTSMAPASNGMYRVSCDYEGTVTGDTSGTSTDSATDPNAAPPACPGAQGEVNGKPTCVPSANTPTAPAPPKGDNTNGTGNPKAGGLPEGQTSGTGGAGRTPENGSGTAAGGPSAAYNPTGAPSGPTDSDGEDEQGEPCGGTGQPICRVKVDETGTPKNNPSALDATGQGIDRIGTDTAATVEGIKGMNIPTWSWTFAFPTGCTALTLAAFSMQIDMCQYKPLIHDLMSMVWLSATIWFLFALFTRTD